MFNITIDGVAGCGKSSLAKGLANALNFKYFNTGAMYRGITCEYLKLYKDIIPTKKIMKSFVRNLDVKVEFIDTVQNVFVNGTNYTPYLREEVVSNTTPLVSGFQNLRKKVRSLQREFGKNNDCIMEGRDIGSVVLKKANCKFYLTASAEVRAKRRFDQMKNDKNRPPLEEILQDIKKRDYIDKTRKHGILKPAKDAIIIDNSNDTLAETIAKCTKIVNDIRAK